MIIQFQPSKDFVSLPNPWKFFFLRFLAMQSQSIYQTTLIVGSFKLIFWIVKINLVDCENLQGIEYAKMSYTLPDKYCTFAWQTKNPKPSIIKYIFAWQISHVFFEQRPYPMKLLPFYQAKSLNFFWGIED